MKTLVDRCDKSRVPQEYQFFLQSSRAFSSFSIHPTAVPHWNSLYTADVFGYIARELEFELEQGQDTPWQKVHAAVNGAHGDNSPGYTPGKQGFIEAKRVGLEIGRQVAI